MQRILAVIQKKPSFFLFLGILYSIVIILLQWGVQPTWNMLWFFLGAVIGLYLIDIFEVFLHIDPSPARSIIFVVGLLLVSFFIVSSSGSEFAVGVTLLSLVTTLERMWGQWVTHKELDSWYVMVAGPIDRRLQRTMLYGITVLFLVISWFFIRYV